MNTTNTALAGKRKRIDKIDAGILALIQERMKLASDIAAIKADIGMEIEDLAREEQLFDKIAKMNEDENIPNEKLLEIWGKIVELSKKIQESK